MRIPRKPFTLRITLIFIILLLYNVFFINDETSFLYSSNFELIKNSEGSYSTITNHYISKFGIIVSIIFLLFIYYNLFYQTIGRLNDINKSGWISLLLFIPIVNIILIFFLIITDGSPGINEFGEDPKQRRNDSEIQDEIKKSNTQIDYLEKIEEIKRKLFFLENSFSNHLLNEEEYHEKKKEFDNLLTKYELIIIKKREFNEKILNLKNLLKEKIINKSNYDLKLKSLILEYKEFFYFDKKLIDCDHTTNFYYRFSGNEYGPIKGNEVEDLLRKKRIEFYTSFRKEDDEYDGLLEARNILLYYNLLNKK